MKGEDFLSQNRFFSLETVKKCMKKRPHRHTKERDQQTNVFPQHHKNDATSIIMFASSFNAVRSSPSIISKSRRNPSHLISSFSKMDVFLLLFSSFDEDDETMKWWTKIDIDRFMQSTTKGTMRADPIGMIVSSSGSFLLLSSVFVCRRHFSVFITDRD